jgi:hypothetical protein
MFFSKVLSFSVSGTSLSGEALGTHLKSLAAQWGLDVSVKPPKKAGRDVVLPSDLETLKKGFLEGWVTSSTITFVEGANVKKMGRNFFGIKKQDSHLTFLTPFLDDPKVNCLLFQAKDKSYLFLVQDPSGIKKFTSNPQDLSWDCGGTHYQRVEVKDNQFELTSLNNKTVGLSKLPSVEEFRSAISQAQRMRIGTGGTFSKSRGAVVQAALKSFDLLPNKIHEDTSEKSHSVSVPVVEIAMADLIPAEKQVRAGFALVGPRDDSRIFELYDMFKKSVGLATTQQFEQAVKDVKSNKQQVINNERSSLTNASFIGFLNKLDSGTDFSKDLLDAVKKIAGELPLRFELQQGEETVTFMIKKEGEQFRFFKTNESKNASDLEVKPIEEYCDESSRLAVMKALVLSSYHHSLTFEATRTAKKIAGKFSVLGGKSEPLAVPGRQYHPPSPPRSVSPPPAVVSPPRSASPAADAQEKPFMPKDLVRQASGFFGFPIEEDLGSSPSTPPAAAVASASLPVEEVKQIPPKLQLERQAATHSIEGFLIYIYKIACQCANRTYTLSRTESFVGDYSQRGNTLNVNQELKHLIQSKLIDPILDGSFKLPSYFHQMDATEQLLFLIESVQTVRVSPETLGDIFDEIQPSLMSLLNPISTSNVVVNVGYLQNGDHFSIVFKHSSLQYFIEQVLTTLEIPVTLDLLSKCEAAIHRPGDREVYVDAVPMATQLHSLIRKEFTSIDRAISTVSQSIQVELQRLQDLRVNFNRDRKSLEEFYQTPEFLKFYGVLSNSSVVAKDSISQLLEHYKKSDLSLDQRKSAITNLMFMPILCINGNNHLFFDVIDRFSENFSDQTGLAVMVLFTRWLKNNANGSARFLSPLEVSANFLLFLHETIDLTLIDGYFQVFVESIGQIDTHIETKTLFKRSQEMAMTLGMLDPDQYPSLAAIASQVVKGMEIEDTDA